MFLERFHKKFEKHTGLFWDSVSFYKDNFVIFFKLLVILFIPAVLYSEYLGYDSRLFLEFSEKGPGVEYYSALGLNLFLVVIFLAVYVLSVLFTVFICEKKEAISVWGIFKWTTVNLAPFLKLSSFYLFQIIWGLARFIMPGFRNFLFYSYYPVVYITEGKGGMDAFKASEKLILPQWRIYAKHMFLAVLTVIGYSLPLLFLLDAVIGFTYMNGLMTFAKVFIYCKTFVFLSAGVVPVIYYKKLAPTFLSSC